MKEAFGEEKQKTRKNEEKFKTLEKERPNALEMAKKTYEERKA